MTWHELVEHNNQLTLALLNAVTELDRLAEITRTAVNTPALAHAASERGRTALEQHGILSMPQ